MLRKNLSLVLALAVGGLTACSSSVETPPVNSTPPVNTQPSASQSWARAQEFLGTWTMTYKVGSTFTDTLNFVEVMNSSSQPDDYFAVGKDQNGSVAVAWYDFKDQEYVAASGPDQRTAFYEFPTIASDGTVKGTVWFSINGQFSDDYAFWGKRNRSGGLSINPLTVEQLNQAQAIYVQAKAERH